jgi:hypothetical protein
VEAFIPVALGLLPVEPSSDISPLLLTAPSSKSGKSARVPFTPFGTRLASVLLPGAADGLAELLDPVKPPVAPVLLIRLVASASVSVVKRLDVHD